MSTGPEDPVFRISGARPDSASERRGTLPWSLQPLASVSPSPQWGWGWPAGREGSSTSSSEGAASAELDLSRKCRKRVKSEGLLSSSLFPHKYKRPTVFAPSHMLQSLHQRLGLLSPAQLPGQGRGQPSTGRARRFRGRTPSSATVAPTQWLQAARSLPPAGTGIDLACFRGSAGSFCFPTRLSESRPPTLTLGTAQPCRELRGEIRKEMAERFAPSEGFPRWVAGLVWMVRRGTGVWAPLTHPETRRALPAGDVRDQLPLPPEGLTWVGASSYKVLWERIASFRTRSLGLFLSPVTSSAPDRPQVPSGSHPGTFLCGTHLPSPLGSSPHSGFCPRPSPP